MDVHHIDHNYLNNSLENLERICRSCHSREHRQRGLCTICGQPQKGLGYCDKHYQRFKKWGDPLAVKENQFTPVTREGEKPQEKKCKVLDCTGKYHAKGFCSKHAQQDKRGTIGKQQMTKSEAALARWANQ